MRQILSELKYSFHVLVHPIDGFWDLKHEKRGSVKSGLIIFALFIITQLFSKLLTGKMFNTTDILEFNILKEIAVIGIVFILFIISNWCLTTLMDGSGSLKDIFVTVSYSLVPMVLFAIPLIAISNFLSLREGSLYTFFFQFSQVWTGFLVFFGLLVTHQYTVIKNIFAIVFTLLGICIMLFIGLLFFNLIQQVLGFVMSLYQEIVFRLN